jgi:hypothetical protein
MPAGGMVLGATSRVKGKSAWNPGASGLRSTTLLPQVFHGKVLTPSCPVSRICSLIDPRTSGLRPTSLFPSPSRECLDAGMPGP